MYDTVSFAPQLVLQFLMFLYRLKGPTGLEIRMPFTTCVERHQTRLSR